MSLRFHAFWCLHLAFRNKLKLCQQETSFFDYHAFWSCIFGRTLYVWFHFKHLEKFPFSSVLVCAVLKLILLKMIAFGTVKLSKWYLLLHQERFECSLKNKKEDNFSVVFPFTSFVLFFLHQMFLKFVKRFSIVHFHCYFRSDIFRMFEFLLFPFNLQRFPKMRPSLGFWLSKNTNV